jgi:hypothetical protein
MDSRKGASIYRSGPVFQHSLTLWIRKRVRERTERICSGGRSCPVRARSRRFSFNSERSEFGQAGQAKNTKSFSPLLVDSRGAGGGGSHGPSGQNHHLWLTPFASRLSSICVRACGTCLVQAELRRCRDSECSSIIKCSSSPTRYAQSGSDCVHHL